MLIRHAKLPAPKRNRGRQLSAAQITAQNKAIEKTQSKYIRLICGHYTTWDAHLIYVDAAPRKNCSWCEVCNKWVTIRTFVVKRNAEYPDEPMF